MYSHSFYVRLSCMRVDEAERMPILKCLLAPGSSENLFCSYFILQIANGIKL